MLHVRLAVVLLLLWLGTIYNIERLHEPINLASFVYVLTAMLAATIISIPKIRRLTFLEITFLSLPIYAITKWYLGYEFAGSNLPITVTECLVIFLTGYLAWRVGSGIDEFVQTAGQAAELNMARQVMQLKDMEPELYEEVQRARRFKRNLSLATVSFHGTFNHQHFESLLKSARKEIVRKYLESKIAQKLVSSAKSGDLVALHNGEFVLMFPEADRETAQKTLLEIESELADELGVRLQAGFADFPNQECTLTGLIERAEADMTWLVPDGSDSFSKSGPSTSDVAFKNAIDESEDSSPVPR